MFDVFGKLGLSKKYSFFFCICVLSALNFGLMALLAPHFNAAKATCEWDCGWYLEIVRRGYDTKLFVDYPEGIGQNNWAFFPLYPAAIYIIHKVFFTSVFYAALLVNIIVWPIVIFMCYRHASTHVKGLNKFLFSLFFIIFPFNIYYTSQYSEGTFGFLLMATLLLLKEKHLKTAALCCFFLSLTRPPGFLAAIFIAGWLFLERIYKSNSVCRFKEGWIYFQESFLLLSSSCAGLSCYILFLAHHVGDGFAFAHIQYAWGRHFTWLPVSFIKNLPSNHGRLYDTIFTLFLFCLYKMYKQKWFFECGLLGLVIFVASSTGLGSIQRFAFSNPLIIEFLACYTLKKPPSQQKYIFVLAFIFHVFIIISWYSSRKWLM